MSVVKEGPEDIKTLPVVSEDLQTTSRRKSVAQTFMALVALIFLIHWARAVLIPIAMAICIRYALMPLVEWMHRKVKIPMPVGAAVILGLIVAITALGVASLHDPVVEMIEKLPLAARKMERAVKRNSLDQSSTMAKLNKAATEIDRAAASSTVQAPAPTPAAPSLYASVRTYLLSGSLGFAALIGQAASVLALAYFLLIAGDTYRKKLLRISGDTLGEKKLTLRLLHDIDDQIQRYFLIQIASAVIHGLLSWLILALIGLENAAFWGLVAGVLHLIPYAGPIVFIGLTAVVAYLQFSELGTTVLLIASLTALTGLVGFGMTPWLTGKFSRLEPVTVFVTLLVWGWLWGIWGLILGVPLMMALQAVCEHVPGLEPIAELLGSAPETAAPPAQQQ